MGIEHRIKSKFKTRNEEIIARLRAEAGADAPRDPIMTVKKRTAELAYLMALVHGGDWRVQIDHEVGLIVVARRRGGRRQNP